MGNHGFLERKRMMIRFVQMSDVPRLRDIYAYYVKNTVITFEYDVPSIKEFTKRVEDIYKTYPYLVYEENNQIIGYAYAHRHMQRDAYKWNVELSVYLSAEAQSKGAGTALYSALLELLKRQNLQKAISCITLPNEKSIALHKKFGFDEMGLLHQAGYKCGAWHDVIWLSKDLNGHGEKPKEWIRIEQLPEAEKREILKYADKIKK